MSREDVYSIIAYMRSLKPVKVNYPGRMLDFPLNIIVHTMPQKASLGNVPDVKDTVKYGQYLVTIAACGDCHSQANQGKPVAGLEYAGGRSFTLGDGSIIRSANITSDRETGIGSWTKEQFVNRFKQYSDSTKKKIAVRAGEFQTIMPWYDYATLKTSDLEAIYAYVKTIKPVNNRFVKFQVNSSAALVSK